MDNKDYKISNLNIKEGEKIIISNDNLTNVKLVIYFENNNFYIDTVNTKIINKDKK